jgi:8-oxo-dGTP pyrophosphatase MutT (NUDIX family)
MLAVHQLAQMFPHQCTTSPQGAHGQTCASVANLKPAPQSALSAAMDDLVTRFLNCPGEDISEGEELMLLMFEVEKAHWFYTDFWRERNSSLPSLGMRDFASRIFSHAAFLRHYVPRFDSIFTKWQEYKRGVPTFGAIILNSNLTKVLMVQGYGGKSWGWPKGKLNRDESDAAAAAREVYEEIGFDVTPYIEDENAVVAKMGEQYMKLFIIPGIPEDTVFETLTRQEIKDIKWHVIADLQAQVKDDTKKNKYYSVLPVIGRLMGWIRDYKRSLSRSKTPQRGAPVPASSSPTGARREKGDKKGKKGGNYSLVQQETDAAGVARDNADTFGATFQETAAKGFSADEMFKVNAERFNIHSTYSFDQYTTPLPGKKEDAASEKKGLHAPERFRPCQVQDAQVKACTAPSNHAVESDDGKSAKRSKAKAHPAKTHATKKDSVLLDFRFDRKAIVESMGF